MSKIKKIIIVTILIALWIGIVIGLLGLVTYMLPPTETVEKVMDATKFVFAGAIPGYIYVDFILDMAADSDILKHN